MTRIKLTDGYFILAEDRQYILKRNYIIDPVVSKNGKVEKEAKAAEKVVGYYGNLDKCIGRYLECVQNTVKDRSCNSIKEYAEMVDQINTVAIEAICGLLKKGGLVVC